MGSFLRNTLLVLGLALGILVIVFHESIVEKIDSYISAKDDRPTIATVLSHSGQVRFKKAQSLRYKNVKNMLDLKDQDSLTTDSDSSAKISFKSGFEIEVLPNSLIVIENPKRDASGAIQITFLKGEFNVLKTASAGQVIVNKNKTFQDLAGRTPQEPVQIDLTQTLIEDIQKSEETQSEVVSQKLEEKKKTPILEEEKKAPVRRPRETLSDEYIAQIINSQKPFFNRCYAQHLRMHPDSHGQIHLAFTIDIEGKVSSVSLINSTMSDNALEKCTMSVIERCRFKKFDGDPIVVNYPINFE